MLWHSKNFGNPGGRGSYALEIHKGGGVQKMLPSMGVVWIFSGIVHLQKSAP